MDGRLTSDKPLRGYCLAEAMLVIGLICISFGIGYATFPSCLRQQEARSLSQSTQAATAWAQLGVLWRSGVGHVRYDGSRLEVDSSGSCEWGADLGGLVTAADVSANIARWSTTDGFSLRFLAPFASPDSGGSLYFESQGGAYKVTIRPESGLTTRRWVEQ